MATHRVLEANAEMSNLQEQFLLFEKIEGTLHLYDFLACALKIACHGYRAAGMTPWP